MIPDNLNENRVEIFFFKYFCFWCFYVYFELIFMGRVGLGFHGQYFITSSVFMSLCVILW